MDGQPCPGCQERDRIIDALQRRIAEMEKRLDTLERTSKRQTAPFSKGDAQAQPKKTGRKAGKEYGKHARRPPLPPEDIGETLDASLPDACAGAL
jgi:hypothetical protein